MPEGVTVEIKHFLSLPGDPEVKDYMEGNGHWHDIVKVTMEGDKVDLETIGEAQPGLTEEGMFSTSKFQGQSFCHIAVMADGSECYTCKHSAPKVITITQNSKLCPHEDDALSLHCYSNCTAKGATQMEDRKFGNEKFERYLRMTSDITTKLSVDLVTAKNNNRYDIFVSVNRSVFDQSYKISHNMLCKHDGAINFGSLHHFELGCCREINHCNTVKKINVKVKAEVIEADDEAEKYYMSVLDCIPAQQTPPTHTSNNTGTALPSNTTLILLCNLRSSWRYFCHQP